MKWWHRYADNRQPDFVIGSPDAPYLRRWWVIPRNKFFNVYLHNIMQSDDDRALHDHPWVNLSIILEGSYVEHTIAAGGVYSYRTLRCGDWKLRRSVNAHRLELPDSLPCWTLFMTGPTIRMWGFHCPHGWVPWKQFVDPTNTGQISRGCDGMDQKQ